MTTRPYLSRAAIDAAEYTPRETGRIVAGDTVADRDARNAAALGDARRAVWGYSTRILQLRGRAAAMRHIAEQPLGVALAEALADATAKRDYYGRLVADREPVA